MHELVAALPKEVLDFVIKCRKRTYPRFAVPNFDTGHRYEWGFRFDDDEHGKLLFTDTSTEQHGRFSGVEWICIKNAKKRNLCGQKYYQLTYAGADEEFAEKIGKDAIAEVQHGLVISEPTVVRFGEEKVVRKMKRGKNWFLYEETGIHMPWGSINKEILYIVKGKAKIPVYTGASQLTVFEIIA